jgi:endonuclease/exonuclease/phosphatase family metal-dependent hydrolase
MNRALAWVVIAASLVGCGGNGGGEQEVTIDTFNVALAGAFVPYEQQRRQPIADAMAEQTADLICLQEVWDQTDKELIREAVADAYPYVVSFEDNLDTQVDDPTDQQGEIPPAPTTVPCPDIPAPDLPGVTIQDQMNGAIDCVRDNCSTIPGSDEGYTTSADCAETACIGDVGGLLLGDEQQQRCYACVVTQLPTAQLGYIRSSCAEIVNQELAFNGQSGVMLLSRHPLVEEPEEWVLPGTWNRRIILHATVKLPNGSDLDAYCNHLTPIFTGLAYPYTGQYGNGLTGAAGWQAEQELQAQKLIDYVDRTSGDRPAVILGDFNASHAYPAQDIVAEGEPALNLLETQFEPAYTSDYTPQCTFCSDNVVAGAETSSWIDHILLYNLPADPVVSTMRIFDQPVVPVDSEMVPLSDHYGMRSVVTVP